MADYFESGHFDRENRKYIITNMTPVRPLKNYIWSEDFMMVLDHFGCGESFAKVAYNTRRKIVDGEGARLIYVKDRESGQSFCTNRAFTAMANNVHEAQVEPGIHTVIGENMGIRVTLTLTTPLAGYVELWRVKVENKSNSMRDLSIYAHAGLQADYTGHRSYTLADYREDLGGILYTHHAYPEAGETFYEHSNLYFCSDTPIHSYTTTERSFKGLYRTFAEPIGIEQASLDNAGTSFDDYNACAMEIRMQLATGEEKEVYFAAGAAQTAKLAEEDAKRYLQLGFFEQVLEERRKKLRELEKTFVLETGNVYMDDMITTWLKNQIDLGKSWARVYGNGFRDVMQDVAAFVSMDTEVAKKKILHCLSHQFANGNTLRMYEPILARDYRDGATWIPETVSSYLNESGDVEFLYEECPYYQSEETGSVLDHIRRGLTFLTTTLGEHGLCLWGAGDWNDSTNAAGLRGRGESVWLSIATVKALKTFSRLLQTVAPKLQDDALCKEAKGWLDEAEKLTQKIKEHGWDSDHYIHGYNDDGKKVGAYESAGAKFYLNMQTWAILAGIETEEAGCRLMDRVEEKLHCPYGYVQCAPSYVKGDPTIGRTTYFVPGCVENGSVYNHGVTFKIAADCFLGRGEIAYRTIKEILATNPELKDCGVEPYAATNMYIGPENPYCAKSAPCSWITGTAGWLYRCITEYLLGVQAEFNGLRIAPCIPNELDGTRISRIYRGATYHITLHKGNRPMVCDGVEIEGNLLPIFAKGTEHRVEVWC